MLVATLEDALAVGQRPNMPSTTVEWPNWSLALPAPIEALETAPLALDIAAALRREHATTAGTKAADAPPLGRGRGAPQGRTE
jgi:4-alpha-glucanotransferase